MSRRDVDLKGQNLAIGYTLAAAFVSCAFAPWVWPIGALFGVVAGGMVYAARGGHARPAGIIGILVGIIGGAFTLPPPSVHSFLVPANWSHPQMLPVLSLYSVALAIGGVWLLCRTPGKSDGG